MVHSSMTEASSVNNKQFERKSQLGNNEGEGEAECEGWKQTSEVGVRLPEPRTVPAHVWLSVCGVTSMEGGPQSLPDSQLHLKS